MKNIKIILALFASLCALSQAHAQSNTTTNATKATAQLVGGCQIAAQTVSFGSLSLPITTQQATSNMKVLCSKEMPYSITIGTMSSVYLVYMNGNGHYYAYDSKTNTAGDWLKGDVSLAGCSSWNDCLTNKGYKVYDSNVKNGVMGCNYPSCTIYTTSTFNGAMKGASKGDSIGYMLKNPANNNPWNSLNAYNAVGNGVDQNIPLVAQLLPGSSSPFPSPDMYSDTVSAVINF